MNLQFDDLLMEDEISVDDAPSRVYKPVSPRLFTTMMFIWTWPVSGIGLALNWRGLGKPRWILPTLLLSIGIPLITFGPIFLIPSELAALQALLFMPAMAFNIGYVTALGHLQREPYQKWRRGRVDAMLNHLYYFTPSIWRGVWWTVGIIGLFFLLLIISLLSAPR